MQYNDKDPWHVNAHLVFGFQCQNCEAEISTNDFPNINLDLEFLEYCVNASTLAKARGWVCAEEFSFLCPACAKKITENIFTLKK